MRQKRWLGRRVLLTGHTGFKGAWLAIWLHSLGAHVTGLSLDPPTTPSLFELARVAELLDDVRADVRDARAVEAAASRARPDIVFHLAAESLVGSGFRNPSRTLAVNVLGTAHVLDAVRGVPVVVVTSDKCYLPSAQPRRESDPLGGTDPYSASKAAQEHVAAAFRDSYKLPIATARAGNVIGGGDWARDRLVPDMARAAAEGRAVTIRHPAAVRPWQHVLEPLDGYLRLAEGLLADEPVAEAWNFGPEPDDERPVAWLVQRWGLTTSAGEKDARELDVLRLDSTKARTRLGWRPRCDLEAGLDSTIAWYRALEAGSDARAITLDQIAHF